MTHDDQSVRLTFYTHPGWRPRIRPASPKRDWMEATPERFAYRCLPLAIANAHGWEILSPCGFEARWTGGAGTDAVEIKLDPGAEPRQVPVSLFGQGTLTFHIEALVRTSPGWNIWVGGSPNSAKDGIAPLGAVIETDWSPYSFTMNWRFTRTGHWIRFDEDEPFCFLFPVQRGVLGDVVPDIRPLEEAPELAQAFAQWSESRNAFQAWVEETRPAAPADRWQKLYYRGVDPDGRPRVADHETKLRLAPPSRPGAASQCPAASGRAPPPARESGAAAAAIDASVLEVDAMNTTLTSPGLAAFQAHAAGSAAAAAAAATPVPVAVEPARALAQREWLLSIAERQRALSTLAGNVQCVRDLSSEEFLDNFYATGRPVLIEGAMDGWPALERWTPAYLRDAVGPAAIEFQGGRADSPDFELYKDNHKRGMPFDRFIDLITADGGGNDAYITAYNSDRNNAALAPLQAELGTLDRFLAPGPGMMWIGPMGTFTPLHFDLTNNLLAQVVGRKSLILLPPSETGKLYNSRHVFSDVHDLTDPAQMARCPLAAQARCFAVELNPGDLLYIPVGWWHQVTSLEFSVMLTYTNFLWPNDAYETFPGN